jgi:hypothetical protein
VVFHISGWRLYPDVSAGIPKARHVLGFSQELGLPMDIAEQLPHPTPQGRLRLTCGLSPYYALGVLRGDSSRRLPVNGLRRQKFGEKRQQEASHEVRPFTIVNLARRRPVSIAVNDHGCHITQNRDHDLGLRISVLSLHPGRS